MRWLSWIVFGALAGWVASLVLRDKRGCLTNMVTGILGAVLAGFIYRWATGVPGTSAGIGRASASPASAPSACCWSST